MIKETSIAQHNTYNIKQNGCEKLSLFAAVITCQLVTCNSSADNYLSVVSRNFLAARSWWRIMLRNSWLSWSMFR